MKETEDFFHSNWDRAMVGVFQEGWTAVLRADGVPEGNELYTNIAQPTGPESVVPHSEVDAVPSNGLYDVGVLDTPPHED